MSSKNTVAHDHLINACRNLLTLMKVPYTRINQRPVETSKGWRSPGADPGTPDILACLPPNGCALLIECKTGSATVSRDQAAFILNWTDAGAKALVIRDVRDLRDTLNKLLTKPSKEEPCDSQ